MDDRKTTDENEAERRDDPLPSELWPRILWILVIALMINVAQSILFVVAVLQIIIMAMSRGKPNEELADFGCMVGAWIAKASRFQSAASDIKPWPWTPMGS